MSVKKTNIEDVIESLKICFGFKSADEIFEAAKKRYGRADYKAITDLLGEVSAEAIRKSEEAFNKYNTESPNEAAIDEAIQVAAISSSLNKVGDDV